jgi:hypothetical protein
VPSGRGALSAALRRSSLQGPRRRSLVVLTDGYDRDELRSALRACRAAGTDVYLILVHTPEELDPGLRGEFTLVDSESEVESGLTVDRAALKKYRDLVDAFRADWREFCRQTGVVMIEIGSDAEIGPGLFRTLAEGGLIT